MNIDVRFIGIDFGTSTSVVSYMDYARTGGQLTPMNNLQPVMYNMSHHVMTVIMDDGKRRRAGNDVSPYDLETMQQHLHTEFKMHLGTGTSKAERMNAIELCEDFFRYLGKGYMEFEKAQGHRVSQYQVYVSYPAKWDLQQRSLTLRAAQKAFANLSDDIHCMDEPTASLMYAIHSDHVSEQARRELRENTDSYVMILDMGAGTTDIVIFRYRPGAAAEVITKYPLPGRESVTFGGREIDRIFMHHFKENYTGLEDENEVNMLAICKRWKELASGRLRELPTATVDFLPDRHWKPRQKRPVYNRETICSLLGTYLHPLPSLINEAISDAKNNNATFAERGGIIDLVILTGGHSQWFFVEDILRGNWVPGLPGNKQTGSGVNLTRIKKASWRLVSTSIPQDIVSYGLSMSGKPIEVVQLSASDVWIEIDMGLTKPRKEKVIRRGQPLPRAQTLSDTFEVKLHSDDIFIPIVFTPIIGKAGLEYLDPVRVQLGTSLGSDFWNWLFNDSHYRNVKVKLELTCCVDENDMLSFSGTATTPGWTGFEEEFSLSATDIADRVVNFVAGAN